jgi:hypothetical protein
LEYQDRRGKLYPKENPRKFASWKVPERFPKGWVLFTTTVYIDAWSSPIPVVLDQLQLAHSQGMEPGDIESAHRAWAASNMHTCAGGFPLNYVLQDATNHLE